MNDFDMWRETEIGSDGLSGTQKHHKEFLENLEENMIMHWKTLQKKQHLSFAVCRCCSEPLETVKTDFVFMKIAWPICKQAWMSRTKTLQ